MGIGDVGEENSKKKPPFNALLRIVGLLAAVAAFVGFKYAARVGINEAQIAAKNLTGSGWEDSREELNKIFRAQAEQAYPTVVKIKKEEHVQCVVDNYITWLNQSGCSYLYNSALKSAQEHLTQQESCLNEKGSEQKVKELDLLCGTKHLPNDWRIFERTFFNQFVEAFKKSHPDKIEKSVLVAECVSKRYGDYLNVTGCKPFPTSPGSLSGEPCLDQPSLNPPFEQSVGEIWQYCIRLHTLR